MGRLPAPIWGMGGDKHFEIEGEKLEKGNKHMWLDGKVAVRGMDDVSFAYALNFFCHLALLLEGAHMFDHGVGEHNFELLVFERGHGSCITNNADKIGECRLNWLSVQQCKLQVILSQAHVLPKALCSTDIKNVKRPGETGDKGFDKGKALFAKVERDGNGPLLFPDRT